MRCIWGLWSSSGTTGTAAHSPFKYDEVGAGSFWHGHDAEVRAACSIGVGPIHLID
jgi:hypothetical protein